MHELKSSGTGRLTVPKSQPKISAIETKRNGRLDIAELQRRAPPLSKNQQELLKGEQARVANGNTPWDAWHTPLDAYSKPYSPKFNGNELTLGEYIAIVAGDRLFRLLDIGTGSGMCWPVFLKKHSNIEYYGSSLDAAHVVPELKGMVVVCGADAIAEVFPHGYFDMVVSHNGMHDDEMKAMAASQLILKARGEAIFVGSWFTFSMPTDSKQILNACHGFEVLGGAFISKAAAYHLRKVV